MIVSTGLGNTVTDVASEINSGSYSSVPMTLVEGLLAGDGWAYMLTATGLWLGYKVVTSITGTKRRITGSISDRKRKSTARAERIKDAEEDLAAARKGESRSFKSKGKFK